MERSSPGERLAAEHAIGDLRFAGPSGCVVKGIEVDEYQLETQEARHEAPAQTVKRMRRRRKR